MLSDVYFFVVVKKVPESSLIINKYFGSVEHIEKTKQNISLIWHHQAFFPRLYRRTSDLFGSGDQMPWAAHRWSCTECRPGSLPAPIPARCLQIWDYSRVCKRTHLWLPLLPTAVRPTPPRGPPFPTRCGKLGRGGRSWFVGSGAGRRLWGPSPRAAYTTAPGRASGQGRNTCRGERGRESRKRTQSSWQTWRIWFSPSFLCLLLSLTSLSP